jgi:hypothetical protein
VLVTALVVLACAWLALAPDVHPAQPPVELEISPLPSGNTGCRPRGSDALEHARSLEQVAAARWERVPFALHEAPRAVAQIAEAEACFAAANDRSGRARAAAVRRSYAAELERRFVRARLLLRAALRQDGTPERVWPATFVRARAERLAPASHELRESAAIAREQVAILLALLDRAPPSALAFRAELEQLARHYAAGALRGSPRGENGQ